MKVMILAAGYGKRLLPLTKETPKPLLKVGNKTLIQHNIEHFLELKDQLMTCLLYTSPSPRDS